ncbi:MAG: PepSY-associated TM helix domain-containing protein [Candidatus Andeanibacterium colombiense]|uniref:PepSY-associated TM helix domain-containing protein n=1 Tax=Candidatus Andeanibacterium colombiense TaxID=3121345 RepID=A0AAJ6BMY3_9SPHN|nr:MAG: PepSY-associated TM helix domain-containing protein [Sphingomonadaceae bacterium]
MKPATLRFWSKIHTWSSLASTLFLLILCLTGLPLIFHEEIDAFGGAHRVERWDEAALVSLDRATDAALAMRPGEVPIYLSFDEDRPVVNITSGPAADAAEADMGFQPIDRRGAVPASGGEGGGFTDFVLDLHKDLFLGVGGMYFVGMIGALFAAATVSGVVLYSPFARKAGFATVRRAKAPRIRWLDWHNLIGGVTLAWALAVGLTGTINTLVDPITAWWRVDALAHLTKGDGRAVQSYRSGLVEKAVANAMARAPGMRPQFVAFPGAPFSSRDHYAVFLQGATPLTKKLLTPVMVDAKTGEVDAVAPMPWYMKGLLLAQPLHFGDYGGLAMKLVWALLDLVTIALLGTGIYLWLGRIRKHAR